MMCVYLFKYILLMLFVEKSCVNGKTFFKASFQTDIQGPFEATTNPWIEFSSKLPSLKEFTNCQWLNIKFYNLDLAACLWSYCTIETIGDQMKCLQVCLNGIYNTAFQNLRFGGEIPLEKYTTVEKPLNSYQHRTWFHL